MSSITYQKDEIIGQIKDMIGEVYDLMPENERRELAIGLAGSVAFTMTLSQLKYWQENIQQSIARHLR